jgi:hypothetical protein
MRCLLVRRERTDATGFTMGLDEYWRYLTRVREAEAMRAEHESRQSEGAPAKDWSLKGNVTILWGGSTVGELPAQNAAV